MVRAENDRTEEFIRLFAVNQRRIYGFVAAIVPRAVEADDVFQNISAGLWQNFHRFEKGTDFLAWSLQFARFAILKYYRSQRQLGRLVFSDEVLESLADEAATASDEIDRRLEALRGCLQQLPQRSRELIELRYESQLVSCREVAARVGRSVEGVYKALRRIHTLLLQCVERALATEDRL
jgi:RNA polymerase sigma-70 factor (ECF subfamily)